MYKIKTPAKRLFMSFLVLLISFSCTKKEDSDSKNGTYAGELRYGNFKDSISFKIEIDSLKQKVFFSSLQQNAFNIPAQVVHSTHDSLNFRLQSDHYTYSFENKWSRDSQNLQGVLSVDTLQVPFTLKKQNKKQQPEPRQETVTFRSDTLKLDGTLWHAPKPKADLLVFLPSSGNADRSASTAEALYFAQRGINCFHYDKRGTGTSEGNWQKSTMEELCADDIQAIRYISQEAAIPISRIGIVGSSQGAAKVPYILNELEELRFGVAVSCPGVSLLESDLNYWKNRNAETLGENLEDAAKIQKMVFEYIAGKKSRRSVEYQLKVTNDSIKKFIWFPREEDVITDTKLLYNPIPFFEKTTHPLIVVQGASDEIIPPESLENISNALLKAKNAVYTTILLPNASHAMYEVSESHFPYWSKLHPNYFPTLEQWIVEQFNTGLE